MMPSTLHRQQGATMVVALIMLVLLTLFALSAMNASNTGLKIASNTQTRAEAIAAVQQEIDKVMSVDFTRDTVATASVAGNKPVDINNDGAVDYNVVIALPDCISVIPIKREGGELNRAIKEDRDCLGTATVGGTAGIITATGKVASAIGAEDSLCSNSQWHVGGSATDPISGASVSIFQGLGTRVKKGTLC